METEKKAPEIVSEEEALQTIEKQSIKIIKNASARIREITAFKPRRNASYVEMQIHLQDKPDQAIYFCFGHFSVFYNVLVEPGGFIQFLQADHPTCGAVASKVKQTFGKSASDKDVVSMVQQSRCVWSSAKVWYLVVPVVREELRTMLTSVKDGPKFQPMSKASAKHEQAVNLFMKKQRNKVQRKAKGVLALALLLMALLVWRFRNSMRISTVEDALSKGIELLSMAKRKMKVGR